MSTKGTTRRAKYRIVQVAGFKSLHHVQRRFLGIWWNVWNLAYFEKCEEYVEKKLNPVVKEYN